jgi:acyl-CoA synthetase (NDP forming)
MLDRPTQSPLYKIANPDSIAFFGASNNIGRMGTNLLLSVMSGGFPGRIYPVHPSESKVQGLEAFPSAADLPETPDLAVMVLPTRIVNSTLEECGRKGIHHAIVVSGGFKEIGSDGASLEEEMKAICQRYGIRVLGPNGLGVANLHHPLNTTFIPVEGRPGVIGLASQSGSFVTQMFNYLARRGVNFSTAFSVGNEADLDLVDALEYLGGDPNTRVIALYVEGITRGRRFVEAARAISRQKPIVALYVGGSDTGRKAGRSHTGAMAGPDPLYDGVFKQSGVIRAESVAEMFDFARVLGRLPQPAGNRVVVQTNSGGPGAAAADACGRAGLALPALAQSTIEALGEYLPHTGSAGNPVDITFSQNWDDVYQPVPQVLLDDPNSDMLLIYFLTPTEIIRRGMEKMGVPAERLDEETVRHAEACAQKALEVFQNAAKPMVGFTWRGMDEPFSQALLQGGFPLFSDPKSAARALGAMVEYGRLKRKLETSEI